MIKYVVAVLLGVVVAAADLAACGDKFLVPSRGLRFEGPVIDRQSATVLLYGSQGSELDAAFRKLSVETMLRKAGYRPTLVRTQEEFENALLRGGWDVVVVDLADGALIDARVPPAAAPMVLPVAHGVTRVALDDAKKRYRQVLTSPTKARAFLDAIDKAIAARAKARAKASTRAGN